MHMAAAAWTWHNLKVTTASTSDLESQHRFPVVVANVS